MIDTAQLGIDDKGDTDRRITKELFRRFVTAAMESCLSVPDDIWDAALVKVILKTSTNYEVVVAVQDAEEEPDNEEG
jgi:hypothetical protein